MATQKKKAPNKQPKKTVTKASDPKAVIDRIREVIVTPKDTEQVPLITPLPDRDVKGFGSLPFERQAALLLSSFPAHASEIIGSTENSGAGNAQMPSGAK